MPARSVRVAKGFTGGAEALHVAEVRHYTALIDRAREQAIERMTEHTRQLGANAVVGMRFDCCVVAENLAVILADGTARRVSPTGWRSYQRRLGACRFEVSSDLGQQHAGRACFHLGRRRRSPRLCPLHARQWSDTAPSCPPS
ncbi:MAG: YbjQ family protein [Actinobacteria bacterium]|nr:YbjQ family protein [Actinomycetota bacterium]MBM4225822.1 YbjQ family protein [Gammaproteobacteria bacterium]